MNKSITYCKYSGVALHVTTILGRYLANFNEQEHPVFQHSIATVIRIATHADLDELERKVIIAALLQKSELVTFRCALTVDGHTSAILLDKLVWLINKVGAMKESDKNKLPKFVIDPTTCNLLNLDSYLTELEISYVWVTSGRLQPTVASTRLEKTFQEILDGGVKNVRQTKVSESILKWGFAFIVSYKGETDIPDRVDQLIDLLIKNPQKSWKALYSQLNKKTRFLVTKRNLEELRELLFDLIPDDLESRPKRIVIIRYIDELIKGQQKDLAEQFQQLGEGSVTHKEVRTVSGVSYIIPTVKQEILQAQHGKVRPVRSSYPNAIEFAKALAKFNKGE